MDWHKLQHKLFEMDPSDPREDLAKLQQVAQSGGSGNVEPTKNYLEESVEVEAGSMPLGIDSIADFAALAGVNVNEGIKDFAKGVKKSFSAGFQSGADNYNKLGALYKPGQAGIDATNSNPKTKKQQTSTTSTAKTNVTSIKDLSKGDSFKDNNGMVWYFNPNEKNWRSKDRTRTISPEDGFKLWMRSQSPRRRLRSENQIEALEARVEYLESVIESLLEAKSTPKLKPRDPNSQYMNDLRKSGAMGAHKDKKKDAKAGKMKHKGQQYESIADELWARLNATGKS